ncbi:hypothetical protein ABTZ03_14530 [Kitasatospora sp. NPDC096077]|uniref:hypothetical protein n=1 Tax=Kitasatospora sp. NPDC096077 TaxID=3155544 RepID=UPI00332696FE
MIRTALPRTWSLPWTGRTTALSGVLLLLAVEGLAVGVAPAPLRLFLSGVLIGASVVGLLLALLLAHSRQRAGRSVAERVAAGEDDAQWFSARSLEGFPMEQVRPLLLAPDAPGLNRLYTAWVFATHGHDPQWIAHHLDLPTPTARLLVAAARKQNTSAPSEVLSETPYEAPSEAPSRRRPQ